MLTPEAYASGRPRRPGALTGGYNVIVLLEIVGKPIWWLVLLFIPLVNFIVLILLFVELAKVFGKGTGFALGLIFLGVIFFPILGFGSAQYVGPARTA